MDASTVHAARTAGPGRPPAEPCTNIGRLLALQVPVIVKLASRKMRMGEVMRLSPGTIIEFEKSASEPLDLLVNNVVIGGGDVVKVGENFGLRISRIGRPQQMILALGGEDDAPPPTDEFPDTNA